MSGEQRLTTNNDFDEEIGDTILHYSLVSNIRLTPLLFTSFYLVQANGLAHGI